jgi:uncharacterized protein YjbI with pentapeptide repeats
MTIGGENKVSSWPWPWWARLSPRRLWRRRTQERLRRLVDQFGDGDIASRRAALLALEALARRHRRARREVYDTVCRFARQHTSPPEATASEPIDYDVAVAIALRVPPKWSIGLDLTGIVLNARRIDHLVDCQLATATIRHCDFVKARIDRSTFDRATITECRFADATIAHSSFREAVITDRGGGEMSYSIESGAALAAETHFLRAQIKDCDFSGAHITSTHFIAAGVARVDFTGVTISDTGFGWASIESSDFRGATISNAGFGGTRFAHVNFDSARISDTHLVGAVFRSADFGTAAITRSDCRYTTLTDVDLARAVIDRVDFGGSHALGHVSWPSGFRPP